MSNDQIRTYSRKDSVVFLKTDEPFGGLSNMAGGYPLHLNGIRVLTSEALYQACRFPLLPEVQRMIIGQNSPMTAKMKSKAFLKESRPDWQQVRVRIMRWCLRVKLAQNWSSFSVLLLKTGDRPIVEESRKDDFWGAKAFRDSDTLVGMNVLGRLLMELREQVMDSGREAFLSIEPPDIPQFMFMGCPITTTLALQDAGAIMTSTTLGEASQRGLFESDEVADSLPITESSTATSRTQRELKLSGIPWAPRIPEGWQVLRNGRLFAHRVETGFPDLPILEVSLRTGVRVRDMQNLKRKQVMSQKEKYKRAVKGDIAYNMMRMWQGALGTAPVDGLVSPAYVVVNPYAEASGEYYSYLFRTQAYMREVNKFSRGIVADRNRLYWESFKQMPSLAPPRLEQDQIVAFLRVQDGHIARFIKAKRDLIGLLTEQKLRVIDQVVLRGLNPAIKLKPSGAAWLGEIPEHWEVTRLRNLAERITSGSRGWSDYTTHSESGPLFLRIGNLSRGSIGLNLSKPVTLKLPEAVLAEAKRTRVRGDDILLSITAFIGSVAHVPADLPEAYVSQHVACCRLRSESANAKWVAYVLLSSVGKTHGTLCMYGGTKQGLTLNDVKNHLVLLPPKEEQDVLVSHIEAEITNIEQAISTLRREIDCIRDYRDRLIADVVTGQVDVRGWVPGPDDQVSDEDLAALGDAEEMDAEGEGNDGDSDD